MKRIGYLLLIPFFAIVALSTLFGVALIFAIQLPFAILNHHKWKKRLKLQSRYQNNDRQWNLIETGTLIVDSPSLGRNVKHCWWTPDNIHNLSTYPIPTESDRERQMQSNSFDLHLEFDKWCFDHYLSPTAGSAILLTTRNATELANRLRAKSPELICVETWSGPVFELDPEGVG